VPRTAKIAKKALILKSTVSRILARGLGDLPGVMEGPPTMKAEKKFESHFDSALILVSH
jgi:hypothetical protein